MGRQGLLVLSLLLAGCQGSQVNLDPFSPYGPTQIPPPPTGSAGRPDPYYRNAPGAAPAPTGTVGMAQPIPGSQAAAPATLSRFTSDDERYVPQDVAERTAPLDSGASSQPTTSGGLDWRTPGAAQAAGGYGSQSAYGSGVASYQGYAPRPQFPTTVPAAYQTSQSPQMLDPRMTQAAGQIPPPSNNGWTSSQ